MNKTEEHRLLAGISHELRSPIDAILSYGRLIVAESGDTAIREYAQKIESAALGMTGVIDGMLDKAADYGEKYGREHSSLPAAKPVSSRTTAPGEDSKVPLVLIVDDDEMIRGTASDILGSIFRTELAEDGNDALKKLETVCPSLILLDINMPEPDGFRTLELIRRSPDLSVIPVIFLTGDEDREIEIRCLKAGASDFVRKPFVSQVLVERVRRIIELDRLQNYLSSEVAVQTRRSVHLSKEIMLALSKAVDAKDHYTNGHSQRVAAYSAEIARRMGKLRREQEDIYAMGLLHDVGKIGVSEAIINKTSRLDDGEYMQIKTHTTIGYEILKIITEIPGLATGARWHHERYDGRGYPDGLSGTDIPEEARIICVADCYDAMTSNRSYSKVREQAAVREEMLRCCGTQFDPDIARIMVAMIDDDPDYSMSERVGHMFAVPTVTSGTADHADPADIPVPVTEDAGKERPFIPEAAGLDIITARRNISDETVLASTIRRFYDLMPSKLTKLRSAYETAEKGGELSSYRIEAHSMKSSSATVGLNTLSDLAKALELMAKDGNIAGIRELHPTFTEEWEQMYGRLRKAYELHDAGKGQGSGDITAALPDLLTMLRLYMENMDVDAADSVIKLLETYSFGEPLNGCIEELKTAVLALDEDGVNAVSQRILEEIGK
ncbi:MAG: response regulator [Ruminiclostridium sp.]|nr:response regulator [Ruminiclostridium sp.]